MTESYRQEIEDEQRRKHCRDAHARCYWMCGPNANHQNSEGHVKGCPIGDAQAEAQQEVDNAP